MIQERWPEFLRIDGFIVIFYVGQSEDNILERTFKWVHKDTGWVARLINILLDLIHPDQTLLIGVRVSPQWSAAERDILEQSLIISAKQHTLNESDYGILGMSPVPTYFHGLLLKSPSVKIGIVLDVLFTKDHLAERDTKFQVLLASLQALGAEAQIEVYNLPRKTKRKKKTKTPLSNSQRGIRLC